MKTIEQTITNLIHTKAELLAFDVEKNENTGMSIVKFKIRLYPNKDNQDGFDKIDCGAIIDASGVLIYPTDFNTLINNEMIVFDQNQILFSSRSEDNTQRFINITKEGVCDISTICASKKIKDRFNKKQIDAEAFISLKNKIDYITTDADDIKNEYIRKAIQNYISSLNNLSSELFIGITTEYYCVQLPNYERKWVSYTAYSIFSLDGQFFKAFFIDVNEEIIPITSLENIRKKLIENLANDELALVGKLLKDKEKVAKLSEELKFI